MRSKIAGRSETLDIGVYGARGVPSTYSGYETFLTTLLPELVRQGDRVTMYCRPGDGVDSTPWQGVRRRVLPAIPGKNLNTLSHGLVAGLAARAARHDVLLVVNVANAPFCLIGRRTGQPVVLNTDGQEWLRDKWGGLARSVFKGSARISRHCATSLIADCDAMAELYRTEFGAESTVIPYCIPTRTWVPDRAAPEAHGLTPYRYLLVAGRHNPENNIHRVAEQFAASELDLPLVILGTANYDSPVTKRVLELAATDERIKVLGHVANRNEFFDLVHHAGIYLHGHSVGGTNPSLVEAMASSARICALDNPFNRETVGSAGRYFRLDGSQPSEQFAVVVSRLLAESAEQDRAARSHAAERAVDHFGTAAVVGAYRDLLVAAAGARRGTVNLGTRWASEESLPRATAPAGVALRR